MEKSTYLMSRNGINFESEFFVEPHCNKNGECMVDILLKLIMADVEKQMRNVVHKE